MSVTRDALKAPTRTRRNGPRTQASTTDPAKASVRHLQWFGGYKGNAIALFNEIDAEVKKWLRVAYEADE